MAKSLAILGGKPLFAEAVTEQNYLPGWDEFNSMVDGIFERKYYTNHGPLAKELEKEFSEFFGVKHAVLMTNTGIGLMIAVKALGLKGKVIVPAFSHVSVSQAMVWAGLEPVFCDVDADSIHPGPDSIEEKIDENTTAIVGVNLFGGTCDVEQIEKIAARHSLMRFYISSDAIGQRYNKTMIGNFGNLEIFSLHESNIINSTDGCVITTNDDHIAARLRNIRSSYGAGTPVPIEFTGNGRMSEIQAGMALLTMKHYQRNVKLNEEMSQQYENGISTISGISLYRPQSEIDKRNYQKFIIRIDENEFGLTASGLAKTLRAENITAGEFKHFARDPRPPFGHLKNMPNAAGSASSSLQLPIRIKEISMPAEQICDVLRQAHENSKSIASLVK